MIKLLVVRHAESLGKEKNLIDDNSNPKKDKNHLSRKGELQAKKLAEKLKKFDVDFVIISEFKRTFETIRPYLKKHKVKVLVSRLTNERNAGIFSGKEQGVIRGYCISNKINRVRFRPKNGESILDVYKRAKKFLIYLKSNFKGKVVLLCGHRNFLKCLGIILNKKDINHFYSYNNLRNGEMKMYKII